MRPIAKNAARGAASDAVVPGRPRRPGARVISPAAKGEEMADQLGALADRPDLERLFERNVQVPKLLRLMARQVTRHQIQDLLDSKQFERDLENLLA